MEDSTLKAGSYGVFEEEAWMFAKPKAEKKAKNSNISVKRVKNDADLEIFTSVYRVGLPGPEVEKYIGAVVDMFKKRPANTTFEYLFASYEGTPASILSYHQIGTFGGIYAVATVPQFRRMGLAKALLAHALNIAQNNDASTVFLQTVTGGEAEQVFKQSGFKTRFVRRGYTTKSIIKRLSHG